MPERKVPVRQCMGCREHLPKNQLVRVVRAPDGGVTLDRTGKAPGRGAYLCGRAECLKRVRKSRALDRTLGAPLPDEIFDKLAAMTETQS